jgi:protein-L-isoaspartate O-methyltransferase
MSRDLPDAGRVDQWLAALEARHLADLRVPEVTRALRALSSAYVQRRQVVSRGATLDSAGKRAAFALYYAPLHFLTTAAVVRAIGAAAPPPASILDIGCGTGAGAAAWALEAGGVPTITGIDRHPWAVDEARWTYRQLGLRGRARQGDAARLPALERGGAAIAAYTLNELPREAREGVQRWLLDAAGRGAGVLIIEPIARGVTPWWEDMARPVVAAGGRADEWRFPATLPAVVGLLDSAAGLDHRELTARSLYLPGAGREGVGDASRPTRG